MTEDEHGRELQVLSADECYRLLATQQIGRLGVNAEHYPLIFPVNYARRVGCRCDLLRLVLLFLHVGILAHQ